MKSEDEVKASEEVRNADSKDMVVIDIRKKEKVTINSNSNSKKVCRICLESWSQSTIIALGCDCRGELGFSHATCASTWFSFRGNRECEICGKTAKNIHYSNRLESGSSPVGVVRESREVEVEVHEDEVEYEDEDDVYYCWILVSSLVCSCIMFIPLFYTIFK